MAGKKSKKRKLPKSAESMYQGQAWTCKSRGIGFYFTLEEWIAEWVNALGPHWKRKRGRRKHQYCMARIADQGDYRPGNVKIVTCSENIREIAWTEERREKHSKYMKGNTRWQNSSGNTGKRHSTASRKQMSETRIARGIGVGNKNMLGKHHSAKTRKQISRKMTGRKKSAVTRARMAAAQQQRFAMERLNRNERK